MSTDENQEVVRRFLASFSEVRWDNTARPIKLEHVLNWLADDVDWWVPGEIYPMTKEHFFKAFSGMIVAADPPLTITPIGWIVDGNRIAVEAESNLKLKKGGSYQNRYHFLIEVEEQKIVKFWEYCDTSVSSRAFGSTAVGMVAEA